jgi:hypothetical protein
MELPKAVATLALVLAGVVVYEYSRADEKAMARDSGAAREAARRVAVSDHERRKEDFARLCAKALMSNAQMDACRAAYRRL